MASLARGAAEALESDDFLHARMITGTLRIGLLLLSMACVVGRMAAAAERELKTDSTEKTDAILVLDESGSMLVTDPKRLRDQGAKLFGRFLKGDDRLGIIGFSKDAHVIRPLSAFSGAEEAQFEGDVARVGQSGMYTNILAGIRAAKVLLESNRREGANQIIVVLSDGKMEPEPTEGTAQALTTDLLTMYLPDLKLKGVKVYALSFSPEADRELLDKIANSTDGLSWFTPDADKIHQSFADLFLAVKRPQVLPLTSKGFRVDANVQEATFYISRDAQMAGDLEIADPAGNKISSATKPSNVRWFKGEKFDVVTVLNPTMGDWQVVGLPPEEGFATILTNLKLVTDWPASVTAGTPALLQARLYESEKPVAIPQVAGVTRYGFQMIPTDIVSAPVIKEFLFDDGTHGDKIADDGIFSSHVTLENPGEYRLRVIAQGPTFQRSQQMPFRVKPPLVALSVETREESSVASGPEKKEAGGEGKKDTEAKMRDFFIVTLSDEAAQLRQLDIKLIVIDDKRRKYRLPLIKSSENAKGVIYESSTASLPHEGVYQAQASISGESRAKRSVRAQSKPFEYNFSLSKNEELNPGDVLVIETPKEKVPEFPLVGLIIGLLINGIFGWKRIGDLKAELKKLAVAVPKFEPPTTAVQVLASLQKRALAAEIELDDPLFTDPAIAPLAAEELEAIRKSAAEVAASMPAAEAAVPGAPAAEGETAAVDGESTDQPPTEEGSAPAETEAAVAEEAPAQEGEGGEAQ